MHKDVTHTNYLTPRSLRMRIPELLSQFISGFPDKLNILNNDIEEH